MAKNILSALVENKAGVLSKVSGLFSRRNFNIHSLAVGETNREGLSRITIIADGDERTVNQIIAQLSKLLPVVTVRRLDTESAVQSELCLVKIAAGAGERSEIMQIVDIFRARITDVTLKTLTVEITGHETKVTAFLDIIKDFGIIELARTGSVALARGTSNIYE